MRSVLYSTTDRYITYECQNSFQIFTINYIMKQCLPRKSPRKITNFSLRDITSLHKQHFFAKETYGNAYYVPVYKSSWVIAEKNHCDFFPVSFPFFFGFPNGVHLQACAKGKVPQLKNESLALLIPIN